MSAWDQDVPLVSVVIPCFKQAHLLKRSVDSALRQSHPRVEVIVVDDESPDDTSAVAAEYGDQIQYVRQANTGVAGARNTGLRHAHGAFIHFLDADDWLLPGMFDAHLKVQRSDPAITVTCGGWNEVDLNGRLLKQQDAPTFKPDPFHALLPFNLAPPVCYLFQRSAVEAIDGFDVDRRLNGHEDWDLLLRLAAAGNQFARVPRQWCVYQDSPGSSSKQFQRMYESGMLALRKAILQHAPCPTCGDRFSQSRDVFYDHYFTKVFRPALSWPMQIDKLRLLGGKVLTRLLIEPRLFTYIVLRLLRRAGRGAPPT